MAKKDENKNQVSKQNKEPKDNDLTVDSKQSKVTNDTSKSDDSWWESDSVKTVATVIAVLLIPLAIIAWNSMSNSEFQVNNDDEVKINPDDNIAMNLDDIKLENNKPSSENNLEVPKQGQDKNIIVVYEKNEVSVEDNTDNQNQGNVEQSQNEEGQGVAVINSGVSSNETPKDLLGNEINVGDTNATVEENSNQETQEELPKLSLNFTAIKLFLISKFNDLRNSLKNRDQNLAEYQNGDEQNVETETTSADATTEEATDDLANQEITTTEPEQVEEQVQTENVQTEEPYVQPTEEQINETQTVENTEQNSEDERVSDDNTENTGDRELGSVTEDSKSIEKVSKLPNTSGDHTYIVQEGDNVYKISMKICGNQNYYLSNLNSDYLKVGQEIKVNCN